MLLTLIYLHLWLLSYIKILIRLGIPTYTLDLYLHQNKVNWNDVITYPALMTHSISILTFVDPTTSSKNNGIDNLNNDDLNLNPSLPQSYHLSKTISKSVLNIYIKGID
jgi:hypothetical protein